MPTPGRRPTKSTSTASSVQAASATSSPEPSVATEPDSQELTAAEKEIADLKDQLAKAKGAKDPDLEHDTVTNPGDQKNILIHFVKDGFCEFGTVWYKGQELELEPGTAQYNAAKTSLTPDQQEEFYGDVYFRQGEWKGKNYDEKEAVEAERRRGRAAPRVTN
jgi:hypothetical protein